LPAGLARSAFRFSSYAVVVRLPGSWLRWLAPATQWPMSSRAAIPTQNQSHPIKLGLELVEIRRLPASAGNVPAEPELPP
jgi:hypothetical protein